MKVSIAKISKQKDRLLVYIPKGSELEHKQPVLVVPLQEVLESVRAHVREEMNANASDND